MFGERRIWGGERGSSSAAVCRRSRGECLTLVSDHGTSTIVWGAPGKDAATLGKFFDALPEGGLEQLEAVSMDLGLAYIKAVRERAPGAVICFDPFHVIKLATDALDSVRRQVWQSARRFASNIFSTAASSSARRR